MYRNVGVTYRNASRVGELRSVCPCLYIFPFLCFGQDKAKQTGSEDQRLMLEVFMQALALNNSWAGRRIREWGQSLCYLQYKED